MNKNLKKLILSLFTFVLLALLIPSVNSNAATKSFKHNCKTCGNHQERYYHTFTIKPKRLTTKVTIKNPNNYSIYYRKGKSLLYSMYEIKPTKTVSFTMYGKSTKYIVFEGKTAPIGSVYTNPNSWNYLNNSVKYIYSDYIKYKVTTSNGTISYKCNLKVKK